MEPFLSVVVPVYNEADNLEPLYKRLIAVLDRLQQPYEILFTNDGSSDNSGAFLRDFHRRRPRDVRVIDLNGNFGQHIATMAAFERVRGEVVVTLDADLQNPPEEIPKLLAAIKAGHDVACGYRTVAPNGGVQGYVARLLKRLSERATHIPMRDTGCMLHAYRRDIVDAITASRETATFIPALALSLAINPIEVEVEHAPRTAGASKYRAYDRVRLTLDLVTSFSITPLQFLTLLGVLVAAGSLLFVVFIFIRWLIVGTEADGGLTLFAILYFLIGLGILGLGIVGEYIGRIYGEVRRRPRFVIREIVEQIEDAPGTGTGG